ncbi:Adenine phosphoribosyltransferase [Zancudomyces culisetae]|uniref:adenine phosphoribosyltransferase n=1 Tax=Zancudomyces culisetae TaxID=1213189 RepID=A0A1R1PTT0_ZANCU|nr:Adenine phosphoribosyltransferase [Zancudomyces culisetae]|eukprot:OMH84357.1 Adenine phosphoribosyltransferase [Zancudomyces culisetae]
MPSDSETYTIEKVKSLIKTYPDFPQEGILFRDIFPIFQIPAAVDCLINYLAELALEEAKSAKCGKIDVVVGLDARGFLFGPSLAIKLGAKFVPIRKRGKLPGPTIKYEYQKEYGLDVLEIQSDAILPGENVLIVDDLLATGGTCGAAEKLVLNLGGRVILNQFVIELVGLGGRKSLSGKTMSVMEF